MVRRPHDRREGYRRPKRGTPGALPGTLEAHAEAQPSRIVVRWYGPEEFKERSLTNIDDLASIRDPSRWLWVEVTGLASTATVAAIGRVFGLHALALEDVLDPAQRPKVEHYDDHSFVVLKTLTMATRVEAHQLSLFVGERFVVTFQDVEHPALAPVRDRLRHGHGKIRAHGPDYLAYAVIDTVIDHYFPVVEAFDDRLERVEDAILEAQEIDPVGLSRRARRDLQTIRHAVWPARDVVASLLREEATGVSDEVRIHLRDCYDHIMQVQEMVESSREIAASLLEAYLSRVSALSNEVMRVLTVVAAVFIPLTFITGLYGMNFNSSRSPFNMPELNWYWGYPFALLLMAGTVAGSLLYFRRKRWLGRRRRARLVEPE